MLPDCRYSKRARRSIAAQPVSAARPGIWIDRTLWLALGGAMAQSRRKRSHDHASGSGSIRPKPERVSPSKGPESERLKLPQSVKVGHSGRANNAVPAGWIRRIVDARFTMQ